MDCVVWAAVFHLSVLSLWRQKPQRPQNVKVKLNNQQGLRIIFILFAALPEDPCTRFTRKIHDEVKVHPWSHINASWYFFTLMKPEWACPKLGEMLKDLRATPGLRSLKGQLGNTRLHPTISAVMTSRRELTCDRVTCDHWSFYEPCEAKRSAL